MITDPGQEDRLKRGIPIVPVFDGYRAFAIYGIIVYHLLGLAPVPVEWHGWWRDLIDAFGGQLVDVLFIVSGFVVFLPTAARGDFGSYLRYGIRRAARLIPAYWLILLLALLVLRESPPQLGNIALHVVGMQTFISYFADLGAVGMNVNGPVWTLTVEISFYIVLPFVAMAFYRHPRAGLLIGAAIATVWTAAGLHLGVIGDLFGIDFSERFLAREASAMATQLPFWAFSFAAGMFGAKTYIALHERASRTEIQTGIRRTQIAGLAGLLLLTVAGYFQFEPVFDSFDGDRLRHSPIFMIGYSASLAAFMV